MSIWCVEKYIDVLLEFSALSPPSFTLIRKNDFHTNSVWKSCWCFWVFAGTSAKLSRGKKTLAQSCSYICFFCCPCAILCQGRRVQFSSPNKIRKERRCGGWMSVRKHFLSVFRLPPRLYEGLLDYKEVDLFKVCTSICQGYDIPVCCTHTPKYLVHYLFFVRFWCAENKARSTAHPLNNAMTIAGRYCCHPGCIIHQRT